jgi:hypothetical protein
MSGCDPCPKVPRARLGNATSAAPQLRINTQTPRDARPSTLIRVPAASSSNSTNSVAGFLMNRKSSPIGKSTTARTIANQGCSPAPRRGSSQQSPSARIPSALEASRDHRGVVLACLPGLGRLRSPRMSAARKLTLCGTPQQDPEFVRWISAWAGVLPLWAVPSAFANLKPLALVRVGLEYTMQPPDSSAWV